MALATTGSGSGPVQAKVSAFLSNDRNDGVTPVPTNPLPRTSRDGRLLYDALAGDRLPSQPPDRRHHSYAGFGRAYYKLTDVLSLTAGLRYTIENKGFSGTNGAPRSARATCLTTAIIIRGWR